MVGNVRMEPCSSITLPQPAYLKQQLIRNLTAEKKEKPLQTILDWVTPKSWYYIMCVCRSWDYWIYIPFFGIWLTGTMEFCFGLKPLCYISLFFFFLSTKRMNNNHLFILFVINLSSLLFIYSTHPNKSWHNRLLIRVAFTILLLFFYSFASLTAFFAQLFAKKLEDPDSFAF